MICPHCGGKFSANDNDDDGKMPNDRVRMKPAEELDQRSPPAYYENDAAISSVFCWVALIIFFAALAAWTAWELR